MLQHLEMFTPNTRITNFRFTNVSCNHLHFTCSSIYEHYFSPMKVQPSSATNVRFVTKEHEECIKFWCLRSNYSK